MLRIDAPKEKFNAFCRRRHIRRLACFGSVVRDDFDAPGLNGNQM